MIRLEFHAAALVCAIGLTQRMTCVPVSGNSQQHIRKCFLFKYRHLTQMFTVMKLYRSLMPY